MKRLLLLAATLLSAASLHAASKVEGRIHLKDGRVVECRGGDRIRLPRGGGKVRAWRNAFARDREKLRFAPAEVDSVVCWHTRHEERTHKFVPTERGWCWMYIETPHIGVMVYSQKGYDIDARGGIRLVQKVRSLSRSKIAYYLAKPGEEGLYPIGAEKYRSSDAFLRRMARYVADDEVLADAILRSSATRAKTVSMLQDYRPGRKTAADGCPVGADTVR